MKICLSCGKCCEQTEMLLANEDVKRIATQCNMNRRAFSYVRDGYLFLKNKRNYCVFLNSQTKKCTIYEIRPRGCRFYPIVYDPYQEKCVVDRDCTNRANISPDLVETECPALHKFILLLENERNSRFRKRK